MRERREAVGHVEALTVTICDLDLAFQPVLRTASARRVPEVPTAAENGGSRSMLRGDAAAGRHGNHLARVLTYLVNGDRHACWHGCRELQTDREGCPGGGVAGRGGIVAFVQDELESRWNMLHSS